MQGKSSFTIGGAAALVSCAQLGDECKALPEAGSDLKLAESKLQQGSNLLDGSILTAPE